MFVVVWHSVVDGVTCLCHYLFRHTVYMFGVRQSTIVVRPQVSTAGPLEFVRAHRSSLHSAYGGPTLLTGGVVEGYA